MAPVPRPGRARGACVEGGGGSAGGGDAGSFGLSWASSAWLATDLVRAWAPASIVDLGCGDAKAISRIVASLAQPRAVVGVDLSTRALRRGGKAIAKALRPRPRRRGGAGGVGAALVALYEGTFEGLVGVRAEAVIMIALRPGTARQAGRRALRRAAPGPRIGDDAQLRVHSVWYPKLPPEKCPLRNNDHRFEWTRAEFKAWAEAGTLYGYDVFEGPAAGRSMMKPAPGPVTRRRF